MNVVIMQFITETYKGIEDKCMEKNNISKRQEHLAQKQEIKHLDASVQKMTGDPQKEMLKMKQENILLVTSVKEVLVRKMRGTYIWVSSMATVHKGND